MNRLLLIVVVTETVLAAVGLLASPWLGARILDGAVVDGRSGLQSMVATVPLLVFLVWSVKTPVAFFTKLRAVIREIVLPIIGKPTVPEMVLLAIMAGIGEEIFFRGFLQGALARFSGPWIALAVVSALFGLAHLVSFGYAVVTSLIGVYLGAVVLATGNLFVAVGVHALFDFVALLLLTRTNLLPAPDPGLP